MFAGPASFGCEHYYRSGLAADSCGIYLRGSLVCRHIAWSSVSDIVATDLRNPRVVPLVGLNGLSAATLPLSKWRIGVAVLRDGEALHLPGCISASPGQGLQFDGSTPTDIKVTAIRRYWMEMGAHPVPPSDLPVIRDVGSSGRRALCYVTAVAAWLSVCWMTEVLVSTESRPRAVSGPCRSIEQSQPSNGPSSGIG